MCFPGPAAPRLATNGRPRLHARRRVSRLADQRSWAARRRPPSPRRPGTATAGRWLCAAAPAAGQPRRLERTTTVSCRSSRAPSSGCQSTLPGDRSPDRCGYGPRARHLRRRGGPRLAGVPAPVRIEHIQILKQVSAGPGRSCATRQPADRWKPGSFIAHATPASASPRLAEDLRLALGSSLWPARPRLTPARVRRGNRNIRPGHCSRSGRRA
jgi:hypothetical protein